MRRAVSLSASMISAYRLVRLRQRTAGAKRRRHVPHGVEDGRAKARAPKLFSSSSTA